MQWDFTFKGSKYELALQPGKYLLECWGGDEDPGNMGGFGGGLEGGRNSNNWVSYPGAQNSSSHGAAFGHGAHTPCNGGGAVVVGMEAVLIMAKKLLLALLMAMIQMEVQVEAVMFTPEKHRNIIQQDAN